MNFSTGSSTSGPQSRDVTHSAWLILLPNFPHRSESQPACRERSVSLTWTAIQGSLPVTTELPTAAGVSRTSTHYKQTCEHDSLPHGAPSTFQRPAPSSRF